MSAEDEQVDAAVRRLSKCKHPKPTILRSMGWSSGLVNDRSCDRAWCPDCGSLGRCPEPDYGDTIPTWRWTWTAPKT